MYYSFEETLSSKFILIFFHLNFKYKIHISSSTTHNVCSVHAQYYHERNNKGTGRGGGGVGNGIFSRILLM